MLHTASQPQNTNSRTPFCMIMQQQVTEEDLMDLPGVGQKTAKVLIEEGYGTFRELVNSEPDKLSQDCDMVLSAATHVISAASEHLSGQCPYCGKQNLSNSWQSPSIDSISEEHEIMCTSCQWSGKVSDLDTRS